MEIANLGKQIIQTLHSLFDERPDFFYLTRRDKVNHLVILVAVEAFGILVASACYSGIEFSAVNLAVQLSFSICIGISFGVVVIAIYVAIAACREFHSRFQYISSIVTYSPEIKSDLLYSDIFLKIALYLDFKNLHAFSQVSKGCHGMVSKINEERKAAFKEITFGKKEWHKYLGLNVVIEPPLPHDIIQILNGPCPADPAKKVRDTHILTLIPKDLSLKSLENLTTNSFLKYFSNFPICFFTSKNFPKNVSSFVDPNEKSYWILIKKDIIGGSDLINGTRNKTKDEQKERLMNISKENRVHYTLPTTLEAVVSFAHLAILKETYTDKDPDHSTFMHCQEEFADGIGFVATRKFDGEKNICFSTCRIINRHVHGNFFGAIGVLRFSKSSNQ